MSTPLQKGPLITLNRNRDRSWSATAKFMGRPLAAEGKTLGAAMVAMMELMAELQEKNRVLH